MKKILLFFILAVLFLMPFVSAHCPLCTAAVGVAAVSAKYYGIDSTILGVLIGAFGVSTGLWVGRKIKHYVKFQFPAIVLVSFFLTAIPLMSVDSTALYLPMLLFGPSGFIFNKVYWVNKILLGSIIGGVITLLGFWLHNHIKRVRGSVLFPYQGIALTVAMLAVASITIYFAFSA